MGSGSGELVHAKSSLLMVRDENGEPIVGVEMFSDKSEVRAMERALRTRSSLSGIVGQSESMQHLYDLVEQVAPYDIPVLITGESGVGKERFADAVQSRSARASRPYVKVNCAAFNSSLIESELFGHKRGAFTGAVRDRQGSFETANGGTLLLDEIAEMPMGLQAKLLRVLQQGEIQRVGEDQTRTVDVRIIAVTNVNVQAAIADGRLREDLYYRLAGVRLEVPALSARPDDISILAEHFLHQFSQESKKSGRYKPAPAITVDAISTMSARSWRGNVRELENVLRLAFIKVPSGSELSSVYLDSGLEPVAENPHLRDSLNLAELEQVAIEQAMAMSGGKSADAAKLLGIDRSTLWRKLKKLA